MREKIKLPATKPKRVLAQEGRAASSWRQNRSVDAKKPNKPKTAKKERERERERA